jgi:hypothetical protein
MALVELIEGLDLTDCIGVKKWEVPLPAALAGATRGNFPSFIPKTDQDRVQNCWGAVRRWIFLDKPVVEEITNQTIIDMLSLGGILNDENFSPIQTFKSGDIWFKKTLVEASEKDIADRRRFEASLKLDGSSMTVYYNDGQIGVCSRNLDLKRTEGNTFWEVAVASGLVAWLAEQGKNIAVQGELMGPGVQGNRENLDQHELYVFDVFDIDKQEYLNPDNRATWFGRDLMNHEYINTNRIKHCPLVETGYVVFDNDDGIDWFLNIADRKSIVNPIAEGVVFKSMSTGGPTFKIISQRYLLAEKD